MSVDREHKNRKFNETSQILIGDNEAWVYFALNFIYSSYQENNQESDIFVAKTSEWQILIGVHIPIEIHIMQRVGTQLSV